MFNLLRSIFTPRQAPTFQELAAGTCALPTPKVAVKVPKAPETPDVYIINKDTATFGFNKTTASFQADGAVPELTEYDVELLIERGYWGKDKVQSQNIKCKKMWVSGDEQKEAGIALGLSPSWVEKRYGTFAAALQIEKQNQQ